MSRKTSDQNNSNEESNGKLWFGLWMLLVGLAWLQPDHFPPWLSFHSELLAFGSVVAGLVFMLKSNDRGKSNITVGIPEIGLLCIVAVVLIQYTVGIVSYGGDVVLLLQYVGGLTFAICTGRAIGRRERYLECLAWVILIAGLCSTAIALFQATRPYDECVLVNLMPGWRRPGANMGQANHFGTLALWSIGSSVFLAGRGKISLGGGLTFVALLTFGAAMSESRTALLGGWMIALWVLRLPQGKERRDRFLIAGTLVVGGLFLFLLWPRLLAGIHAGGWHAATLENATINTQGGARFVVWRQLLQAVAMRPLFGWGVGGVSNALNAVADLYPETFPFTYAHNVVLDLLVWFGVPLAVALIALVCIWGWRRCRGMRELCDWYAVALLIPFVLHSLLEFPFAYAYFLFPAGFLIGVLDSGLSTGGRPTVARGAIVLMLFVWLAIGIEVIREYRLAEEDYRVARSEALRIGKTPTEYSRPVLPVLTQLDALNKAIRVVPSPNMGADEIESLRQAALRFPSISVQNRYATSLALNGELGEARRQLRVIRAMHGERVHDAIVAQWRELAQRRYPQLEEVFD